MKCLTIMVRRISESIAGVGLLIDMQGLVSIPGHDVLISDNWLFLILRKIGPCYTSFATKQTLKTNNKKAPLLNHVRIFTWNDRLCVLMQTFGNLSCVLVINAKREMSESSEFIKIYQTYVLFRSNIGSFNKSNVVLRCLHSYRQRYSSSQWSNVVDSRGAA